MLASLEASEPLPWTVSEMLFAAFLRRGLVERWGMGWGLGKGGVLDGFHVEGLSGERLKRLCLV